MPACLWLQRVSEAGTVPVVVWLVIFRVQVAALL